MEHDVDVYTVKEVAHRLNISIRTVYNMVAAGLLPYFTVGCNNGRVRIPKADFEQWMKKRKASVRVEARGANRQ